MKSSSVMPVQSAGPPQPLRPNLVKEFALDSHIAFLNHGSFGARPKAVLEAQNRRRAEFEAHPIQWLDRHRKAMIDRAKTIVGEFLGMSPTNFGFVTNATNGINAVLQSLTFKAGDELLTTNHVYNAVRMTMRHVAQRAVGGPAKYIELPVPFPVKSPDEIVRAIEAAITPRTRIFVVDHITSPTAIIFPIERIAQMCQARGVDVIIDGAHTPGMLPLHVEKLGVAYYSGNLHKWISAPVGAAFLWVRPDKQTGIHPTTISHFLDEGLDKEFEWQGTRDITPWLCVEDALAYFNALGWERIRAHNHTMAVWVQQMLCERWGNGGVEPCSPLDGSMIGSMATVQLPQQERLRKKFNNDFLALRHALYDEHRIEAPIVEFPIGQPNAKWHVRPCCHIYNTPDQYERLAEAMLALAR